MDKVKLGNNVFIPMPVTLVGVKIGERANFMTVGWVSRANANPPMIAIGIAKNHWTPEGIRAKKVFTVNLPPASLVEKTDYCGLVSGKKEDKSNVFEVFYGASQNAPMIAECALCLECNLVQEIDLPTNSVFVGEIVGAYADGQCLTDGRPDYKKMNAMLLTMPDNVYWAFGEKVADAWKVGKALKD
jgi:flavin reductase (DIM6/NTAB) family NADH-FMN oxidoreductase RutF